MPSLPKAIHKRLAQEFRLAAQNIADASDIEGKLYHFSVFYGETGRQLNLHWDADLALLYAVAQAACQHIAVRPKLPPSAGFNLDGVPNGYLEAMDEVSSELAVSFEGGKIDVPRFYAALARIAELTYITTGNGAYLHQKGAVKL